MTPAQQVAGAINATPADVRPSLVDWCAIGCLVGVPAAMMWAHLPAPAYRREGDEFGGGREVVKSPADYRLSGGDCDDDVALFVASFSWASRVPLAAAQFWPPAKPRHVRALASDGDGAWVADRVPRAVRWQRWL
jgi:hypothetical protein